jgi:O-antigen/teichoic acid export membrane protein
MSVARTIARNSAVLVVGQLASYMLFFFSGVYTARYLEPDGFGVLSFAVGFTALFAFLPDLGLSALTVRQVARDKSLASKHLANVGLMKVILFGLSFGVIVLVINIGQSFMDYPQQTVTAVYFVGLSVVIAGLNQIAFSMFQAFERMEYRSVGQVLNAAAMLTAVLVARKYGFGVEGFASLYFYASAITLLYSMLVLRWRFAKYGVWSHFRDQIDLSFWKPTLKLALPFMLITMVATLYYHIDTVMIAALAPDEPAISDTQVGWYNAAYRPVTFLLSIRFMLAMAIFPVMSQSYVTSKKSLRLICERYFKYNLIIAIPIGIGTTMLATRFVSAIYGSDYLDSAIALQLLIWSAVLMYLNFANQVLGAIDRQTTATKIIIVGAVANIALNAGLIPAFGYVGAAATTIACQTITLSIAVWIFSRTEYTFPLRFAVQNTIKVIVAAALMGCFVWFCQELNLAILVVCAALIYTALLALFRAFDMTDFHILNGAVRGETILPKLDIDWEQSPENPANRKGGSGRS